MRERDEEDFAYLREVDKAVDGYDWWDPEFVGDVLDLPVTQSYSYGLYESIEESERNSVPLRLFDMGKSVVYPSEQERREAVSRIAAMLEQRKRERICG